MSLVAVWDNPPSKSNVVFQIPIKKAPDLHPKLICHLQTASLVDRLGFLKSQWRVWREQSNCLENRGSPTEDPHDFY